MFAYFAGLRLFLSLSFEIFEREIGARAAKIDLQRMLDLRSLSGSSLLTENLTHHKKWHKIFWRLSACFICIFTSLKALHRSSAAALAYLWRFR